MGYENIYTKEYYDRCDGIASWNSKKLKFGDAFASICYIHGIYWDAILDNFPDIGLLGKNENTTYTFADQVDFVVKNKKRTPKKILEVGGGRGEVTCFLSYMGYDVISIEVGRGAKEWFEETSVRFTGKPLKYTLLNGSVTEFVGEDSFKGVDSVIICESLEHILKEDFEGIYNEIVSVLKETKGTFVVTNWIDYHPLSIGSGAPPSEHCRVVDDYLYDSFCLDFTKCLYRNGSHLCLSLGNHEQS